MNRPFWFAQSSGQASVQPVTPTGPLVGQFCIHVPNVPFGPRDGEKDNVIFLDELDTFWKMSGWRSAVDHVLDNYQARGGNHVMTGPGKAHGYSGQYPDTDWLHDPDGFIAYLDELQRRGLRTTHVALPDIAPYFTDRVGHDWALIRRDFLPFHRAILGHPAIVDIMNGWELLVPSAETARQGDYLTEAWPDHKFGWHNPPNHLCPGLSDEDEQLCVRIAARHGFTKLFLQASPPGDYEKNASGRTPIEEMVYTIGDMRRRFNGEPGSPWGLPVIGIDGKPLTVTYTEGVAYSIHNKNYPDAIGATWGKAARDAGSIDVLDGLPA